MSSEEPYRGPISLAASKYASPQHKARAAVFPSAFPSPSAPKVATNGDSTAVATKEQLAINDAKAKLNADAQLAMAQNENLKKEVEMHSAKVTKSVSSAVANTRQVRVMGIQTQGLAGCTTQTKLTRCSSWTCCATRSVKRTPPLQTPT